MEKITLIIHPFFYIKEDMFRCYHPQADALPLDEAEVFEDLGNFKDDENIRDDAKKRLKIFREGIDFASDGVVVFHRADPDQGYTRAERLLFEYAQRTIPKQDLYFDPPINEKRFPLKREALDFLVNRFGSMDELKDIQLYSFGEDLDACVPQTTCRMHKRGKFSKPAIVLAKYSTPHTQSLDEASKIVDTYFEYHHEFNPRRMSLHWDK